MKKTDEEIVQLVEDIVKAFLVQQGARSTYGTYLRTSIKSGQPIEELQIEWGTVEADEELTEAGFRRRGLEILRELQSIVEKYKVPHLEIVTEIDYLGDDTSEQLGCLGGDRLEPVEALGLTEHTIKYANELCDIRVAIIRRIGGEGITF